MSQYIILMTLSAARSYAGAPSSVSQLWYVPCCRRKLQKAGLWFESGLLCRDVERECGRTRSACAPAAGTLPPLRGSPGSASLRRFQGSLSPGSWNPTANARSECLKIKAFMANAKVAPVQYFVCAGFQCWLTRASLERCAASGWRRRQLP